MSANISRLVAMSMVLAVLVTNLAWAATIEPIRDDSRSATFLTLVDESGSGTQPPGTGPHGQDGLCDHCCSDGVHCAGFPSGDVANLDPANNVIPTPWHMLRRSRDEEPPLPPPNI